MGRKLLIVVVPTVAVVVTCVAGLIVTTGAKIAVDARLSAGRSPTEEAAASRAAQWEFESPRPDNPLVEWRPIMQPVLFLDEAYRPLRIEPWTRAISDVFTGKCEVVHYSRDRTIRGVDRDWPMPSVVRVLRRFKRDRIAIRFSRLNIYTRDDFRCQFCGERFPTEDLTFDHVVPRSQGGRTTWDNIVTACATDNRRKDNRTPEQAGMRLLRRPKKPRYLPVVTVQMDRRNIPVEWRDYWRVDLGGE